MTTSDNDIDCFNYQLLGRLQQDCEYFLGHGNRARKHLWAGDEADQIAKMRELYAGFSEKPAWISLEDIARYEAAMVRTMEASPADEVQSEGGLTDRPRG